MSETNHVERVKSALDRIRACLANLVSGGELDKVANARDVALKERDSILKERDAARKERDTLLEERDTIVKSIEEMADEAENKK